MIMRTCANYAFVCVAFVSEHSPYVFELNSIHCFSIAINGCYYYYYYYHHCAACSQLACMKCCTDIDGCEGHRAMREEKRRQEEILDGTSAVNVRAAKQRRMTVTPGAFPGEPAFRYLQESLIVWDCRQYLDNPKWREDAIRRSERNKRAREVFAGGAGKAEEKTFPKKKEGRKRRFQRIMTELYDASVKV